MITRIIVFILCTGLGMSILKYTYQWVNTIGKSQWAETKIGQGASFAVWKIVAIIIIIFGTLILFGQVQLAPNNQTVPEQVYEFK